MIIRSVWLKNFRNFSEKSFEFGDRINVIFGLNGQGKTNLLEALSVLCLTRSFRTKADADLIQYDADFFQLRATAQLDSGIEKQLYITYSRREGKRITVDDTGISSALDYIGLFPIVILAPEDDEITTGPPEKRRRFVNLILSQLDKPYLFLLRDYYRVLRQRNKILQEAKENRYKFSERIAPWNEKYFEAARAITQKRAEFLHQLEKVVQPIHRELSLQLENFQISYQPSFDLAWKEYSQFREQLDRIANQEILRGTTLIGPHRDEIYFKIDGRELRRFGSRGQHRTCLLALKIGEYFFLKERHSETPVFLLDDVYSEIDEVRERALNEYFLQLKQVFLTTHGESVKLNISGEIEKEIQYIYIGTKEIGAGENLLEN